VRFDRSIRREFIALPGSAEVWLIAARAAGGEAADADRPADAAAKGRIEQAILDVSMPCAGGRHDRTSVSLPAVGAGKLRGAARQARQPFRTRGEPP
jgi:hypothetical protein